MLCRFPIMTPHVLTVAAGYKGIEMRHIGKLAGAACIVLAPTAAFAQMGAPAGAPMQPGSWGQTGWQAGTPGAGYAAVPQGYASSQRDGWQQGPTGRDRGDYRQLERGKRVPRAYQDPSYTVVDWNDWGFAPPGPGLRWVRYYDDGLLIDGDGRIVDARYGVDWNHGRRGGPRIAYAGGAGIYPGGYAGGAAYGYPAPGVTTYRAGPNTTVTTAVVQTPPVIVGGPAYGYAGGATVVGAPAPGYGYAGGAVDPGYAYAGRATMVGTAGALAVTTTTTTTDYRTIYKSAPVRRARVRPIRRYRPRCASAPTCPVLGS
jgi:Ni/Co efflux regulator RcnB